MITPILKRLSFDSQPPDDPENCIISVVASIGPKEELGADYFYLTVVTPKYLAMHWPFWGKSTLVVDSFHLPMVERTIIALLENKSAASWAELANELNAFMSWEFHNYEPSKA